MKCVVCDSDLSFQWSDTHGVGVCWRCGMPYTVYHYEGEGDERKRVDKPPAPAIFEEWIPVGRRYWEETKRRVFPASFDMGFLSRRETSYSGATPGDVRAFDDWLEAHKDELPKPREQSTATA